MAILDAIGGLLATDPANESVRAIARLDPPQPSQFRLRVGEWREYYEVDETQRKVNIEMLRQKGTRTTAEVTQP